MTMLNKIKKTKLKTATRAHTSYTRSASCSLKALCWDVNNTYVQTHTRGKGNGDWWIYVQRGNFHGAKKHFSVF